MLEIRDLDLHYAAAQALRSVNLSASTGEITCLMGRNGVGKTSLLRAITGHHPTSGGAVIWEGRDISGLPPYERA